MTPAVRQSWPALMAALFPRGGCERLLAIFISASLPAVLLSAWYAGQAVAVPAELSGWSREWFSVRMGLQQFLPLFVVAALTGFAWERLFAIVRKRVPDAGWFMAAWLFVLLVPPSTPLWLIVLGMSFGAFFGAHVFGGTGCYVASPAVIAALFLHFAYPSALGDGLPWVALAGSAPAAETGLVAYAFLVTCLAGAFTLVASGAASARTLMGALVALPVAAFFHDSMTAAEHAVIGSFAFCWAFLLTDPSTEALTRAGRWMHGGVFALLVILIRANDPAGPDGVLFAVLLAGLLVPLFDYTALAILRARHGTTLALR